MIDNTFVGARIVKTRLVKYANQEAFEKGAPFEVVEFEHEGGEPLDISKRSE